MQTDTGRIKERLSIDEVIGSYIRLEQAGAHKKALCPFHNEKSPSFIVNEDRQSYHCFGCGRGGDIFSFVMEMDNLSFPEALKLLAERAGVELASYTPEQKAVHDRKSVLMDIMQDARAFYEKQYKDGPQIARQYIEGRGIKPEVAESFHLGFAPEGWHHLEKFLLGRGFSKNDLYEAGLSIAKDGDITRGIYDRFRARIMFPIHDHMGRVIGFSARAMPGDDESAKYINTPETPLYHKSNVLYGIELAKKAIADKNTAILVEGNMDVIALHQAGYANTVAVSGTAMTQSHIKALKRYTDHFVLFFDADAAGQKAARRSAELCLKEDVSLSLVALSAGKDAADLVAAGDTATLDTVLSGAASALTFFAEAAERDKDLADPHQKRLVIEDVLSLAACIENEVERNLWISTIAERYGIAEGTAVRTVEQVRSSAPGQKVTASVPDERPEAAITREDMTPLLAQAQTALTMALSHTEAWRALWEQREQFGFLRKDDLFAFLFEKGEEYNFDPDKVNAEHVSRERFQMIAQYRAEYPEENARSDMLAHLKLLRRTYLTTRIGGYLKHIDSARKKGDQDIQKRYEEKYRELQKELEELIE